MFLNIRENFDNYFVFEKSVGQYSYCWEQEVKLSKMYNDNI